MPVSSTSTESIIINQKISPATCQQMLHLSHCFLYADFPGVPKPRNKIHLGTAWHCFETQPRCRALGITKNPSAWVLDAEMFGRLMGNPIFFNIKLEKKYSEGLQHESHRQVEHSELPSCDASCQAAPSPAICVSHRRQSLQPQRLQRQKEVIPPT